MEFRRGVTLDLHSSVWGASRLLQLIYIDFVATPPPPLLVFRGVVCPATLCH